MTQGKVLAIVSILSALFLMAALASAYFADLKPRGRIDNLALASALLVLIVTVIALYAGYVPGRFPIYYAPIEFQGLFASIALFAIIHGNRFRRKGRVGGDADQVSERQKWAYLAHVANLADLGFLEWNADQNLVSASHRACMFFGASERQLIKDWTAGPDRRRSAIFGTLAADVAIVARDGGGLDRRLVTTDHRGDRRILNASIRRDDSANSIHLIALLQDITEHQKAIDTLHQSEQRFRDFAGSATDWIWEIDAGGVLTFVSAGHDSGVDLALKQFLGTKIIDANIITRSGDYCEVIKTMRHRHAFRSKKINFRNIDGQSYNTDLSGKPVFDASGKFKGYRGTCFDLTAINAANEERKTAIEAFATAVEHISTIVALFDGEDRVVYCNERYREIYTESATESIVGVAYADLVNNFAARSGLRDSKAGTEHWRKTRVSRRQNPAKFLRSQLADGRWIEVSDYPLANDGILTIATEITDRVAAEDALRSHDAALQVFNRRETLGQMAAAIAHELNQPLAAISNFAAGCVLRAENGLLTEDQLVPVLSKLAQQAERASKILRSMSDYLGTGGLQKERVQISAILNAVTRLVQPECDASGVSLIVENDAEGKSLYCAQIEIEQLLINLIKNGLEATMAAGRRNGEVFVRVAAKDDTLTMTIQDNGAGFDRDIDMSAFEPFKSTKEKGLGVGLAICRTIVDSHGGDIRIAETSPKGSTLIVKLPMHIKELT